MRKCYTIPVHPLSKKIMMIDLPHQEEIIILDKRNIYYDHIYVKEMSADSRTRNLSMRLLTDEISISFNGTMELHPNIGVYLYKLHREELFKHTYRFVWAGFSAKEGIRNFYDIYGIEEDELNSDDMYRIWQRWKSGKPLPNKRIVSSPGMRYRQTKLVDDATIRKIYTYLIISWWPLICMNNDKVMYWIPKYLYIYLMREVGQYKRKHLIEKYNIPRQTYDYMMNQIKNMLYVHESAKESYEKALSLAA